MPVWTASGTGSAVFSGSGAGFANPQPSGIGFVIFSGSGAGEVYARNGAGEGSIVFTGEGAGGRNSDLAADTYYVAYTYATIGKDNPSACLASQGRSAFGGLGGETLESPAQSIVLAAGHNIQVTVPAFPANPYGLTVKQANIYIGTESHILYYQGSTTTGVYVQTNALLADTMRAPSQRYTQDAPVLTSRAAESGLLAGTYFGRYVWWTADGPQWFSDQAQIGINEDDDIIFTLPPFPTGVIRAYIFLGLNPLDERMQGYVTNPLGDATGFIEGFDDFARVNSDDMGPNWTEEATAWEIAGETAHCRAAEWAAWKESAGIEDTCVSGDCMISFTPGQSYGVESGLVARMDTLTDYRYAFHIYQWAVTLPVPSSEGGWRLRKITAAGTTDLAIDTSFAPISSMPYALKMEIIGDTIKVWKDGVLLAEVTDSDLSSGHAGMRAIDSLHGGNNVDNFLVENLDARKAVWTQDFPLVEGLPYFRNRTACTTVSSINQFKPQGVLDKCAIRQLLVTAGDSVFVTEGTRLLNLIDDRTPNKRYRGAQANDIFYLVNSADPNLAWDGETLREVGFPTPTAKPGVAQEAGPLEAHLGYSYFVAWTEKTADGVVVRRSPLSPMSDDTGAFTGKQLVVTWSTPPSDATHVEIYRTQDGGSTWYRLDVVSAATSSYTDTTTDDELGTYEANLDIDEDPIFSDILLHKERLWGISGAELHFTAITETGPDYEGWDLENAITIDTGDKDLPRTLGEYHDDLVAHYEDGTLKISGWSEMTMRQRRIYTSTGAMSLGGAVSADAFHYCLCPNGIYIMAGDEMRYGSIELEKTWRSLSKRPDQRLWWAGVRYQAEGKDQLQWIVSTAGSRENDLVIVYDLYTGKKSLFSDYLYNLASVAVVEDSIGRERLYRGDYYGGVWQHDVRYTDHGVFYPFTWLTQPYTRRRDNRHRLERWAYLYHRRSSGDLWMNIYVDLTREPLNATPVKVGLLGEEGSVWGEMVWGTDEWAGPDQEDARQRISLGPRASHRIQFEFFQTQELAGKIREEPVAVAGLGLVGRDRSHRS